MNMIVFDHPLVLLCFIVFIPIVVFNIFSKRGNFIRNFLPRILRLKLRASQVLFRLFIACIIIAAAGPRWGMEQRTGEYRRSLDVVIAMDVSRSMEVANEHTSGYQSGQETRLERGIAIVTKAVEATPETHYAVTVSRNRGIVAVPLTWDSGAVLAFLEAAGSSLTGRGTNLESLVDAAMGAFRSSYPATKLILLVSDGEALSGSLKAAVSRCKRDGIRISTIAVGSDEGGFVPSQGNEGEIISRRDSSAMKMAAGQTGGIYIDGNDENAAAVLISHLRTMGIESRSGGSGTEQKPRWFLFAMFAIMAFAASKAALLKWRKNFG